MNIEEIRLELSFIELGVKMGDTYLNISGFFLIFFY